MSNILNIIMPKNEFTMKGKYYEIRPKDDSRIIGKRFNYRIETVHTKEMRNIADSLQTEQETLRIRTNNQLAWRNHGFIITQDGLLWQIESFTVEPCKKGNEQALRMYARPFNTEYSINLTQIENVENLR